MRRLLRWSEVVLVAAVVTLPFKAGGCGTTACITVTPAQLVGGACPSAADALKRFSDPNCPGAIFNVEGTGTLDGNFCCYTVDTQTTNEEEGCGIGVGGSFAVGGNGGSTGFTSTTGFGGGLGSTTGVGGAGGGISFDGGSCTTCDEVLNGSMAITLCMGVSSLLASVEACACSGECTQLCEANICIGQGADMECSSCIAAASACAAALAACQEN